MKFSERASDLGYAAGWRVVRALPEKFAAKQFDRGADVAARRNGGPDQLRRNLARVLGVAPADVPDDLMKASLRSYARYWREAFRLPSMDPVKLSDAVEAGSTGHEQVDAVLASGKGVILALPHSGNWDAAGVFAVQHWGEFATVAERLKPESLFWRFVRYRESLGFEIVPLSGGEAPPFELLSTRLREGRVVCLMGERDLTNKGVPVTFFGEQTRMPAGAAKLAIETGSPLFPVHCWFTPGGWGMLVGTPIDVSGGVEHATQLLADRFAANIAAHPADWHMLQPMWLDDLSEGRLARMRGEDA